MTSSDDWPEGVSQECVYFGLERLTNLAVRTREKGPGIKSQHKGRAWWTQLNAVSLHSVHHFPGV